MEKFSSAQSSHLAANASHKEQARSSLSLSEPDSREVTAVKKILPLLRATGAALLLGGVMYCTAFIARAQQKITPAPAAPATQPAAPNAPPQ
jgi:hypothetical protein